MSTPKAVAVANAITPKTKTKTVCGRKKLSAVIEPPMEIPKSMTKMSINASEAVLESLSVTPHSRKRFPNMKHPIRGADIGTSQMVTVAAMMGKRILSRLETSRSWGFI
jgi:hypothetical protein